MKVIGNLTKDAIIRAAVSEGITVTQAVGTDVTFNTGSTTGFAAAFDSNTGKVVIAYSDGTDGQRGKARVGTVDPSNNSISLGSAVTFQDSEITGDQMDCVFDSNANKVVIFYTDTNNPSTDSRTGTAIVGTVSGTSISFGTKAAFESGNTSFISACFDSNLNKFVVAYRDNGNSNYGTSAVGTVSGTDISFGTPVVFESAETSMIALDFDSNSNKVVIGYRDQGNLNYGTSIVGTVSGTSISFGSAVLFESAAIKHTEVIFDSSNNKIVIAYQDDANLDYGTAIVGTVSGTSISYGSPVVFNAGQSEYHRGVYDSNAGKIAIIYKDGGNSNRPTFISGAVSGTSITFDTETVLKDVEGVYQRPGIAYDSTNKRVVPAYLDATGSDLGITQVIRVGYSSATGGTIADGSAVIVNANGTVSSVSASPVSEAVGTKVVFESAASDFIGGIFDSTNNKVLIAYRDQGNSNYGTVVCGDVSGTSITFGTPVVFKSGSVQYINMAFSPERGRAVITYQDLSLGSDGYVVPCYVSNASSNEVTVQNGSSLEFSTSDAQYNYVAYDGPSGDGGSYFVISYRDDTNSIGKLALVKYPASGDALSLASTTNFSTNNPQVVGQVATGASSGTGVVSYRATSDYLYGRAYSRSGTTVTFGTEKAVYSVAVGASPYGLVYDSVNDKFVFAWNRDSPSDGMAIVASVSGTTITTGTAVVFHSANVEKVIAGYHSASGKTVISFQDSSDSNKGKIFLGTVSGTSISFGSETLIYDAALSGQNMPVIPETENNTVVLGISQGSPQNGSAVVFRPAYSTTNLTSENFVGFMDGAALDGTNGEILSSCSIARNQTSLTAGQTYFVSSDGSLSLTAGSPSVTAGTAISSTELIVKG